MNVERLVQLELFLAGSVEGYAGSSVANTDAPSCRDTQREPANSSFPRKTRKRKAKKLTKEQQNKAAAKYRARIRALPYNHPLRKKWRDYKRDWDRRRREQERPAREAAAKAKADERALAVAEDRPPAYVARQADRYPAGF